MTGQTHLRLVMLESSATQLADPYKEGGSEAKIRAGGVFWRSEPAGISLLARLLARQFSSFRASKSLLWGRLSPRGA